MIASGESTSRGRPWAFPATVSALCLMAIALGAVFYYQAERARFQTQIESQLNAIADLKVAQIVNWRKERLTDARFLAQAPFVARSVRDFLANTNAAPVRADILKWLKLLQGGNRYERATLYDAHLTPILSAPERTTPPGPILLTQLAAAFRTNDILFWDLHLGDQPNEVHLDILIPVIAPGTPTGSTASAVLQLKINPRKFLYPLVQSWPVPNRTAESALLRREGERLRFLSDVRYRTNTALRLSFPLDQPDLPAAIALRNNREGVTAGHDYRGVPVLTVFRRIPDSTWWLGAKVDQEEISAPSRAETVEIAVSASALALAVIGGFGWLWRRRETRFLRHELAAEHERQALAQRIEHLMRNANDVIVLADDQWRILELNDRAESVYGCSLGELRGKALVELRAPVCRADFPRQAELLKQRDGVVYETQHQRKGGAAFPVEVSGRLVTIGGVTYKLAIIRDITERKRAEAELRRHEEQLTQIAATVPGMIYSFQLRPDGSACLPYASAELERVFGLKPEQVRQNATALFAMIHPDDIGFVNQTIAVSAQNMTPWRAEFRGCLADRGEFWVEGHSVPQREPDGSILWHGFLQDITERKRAERTLRENEQRYRSLFENMLNGFAYCRMIYAEGQPRDFIYLAVNNMFETLTGLKNVVGKQVSEVLPGIQQSDANLLEIYGRVAQSGAPEKFETYVAAMRMWFSVSVYCPQPGHFVAVFDVITERKKAEAELRESLEEKTALLKEVHHRVKNNLQIVASLLNLQTAHSPQPEVVDILHETRDRVRSMALLHEILYRSGNLARLNFAAYVSDLCAQLLRSFGPVAARVKVANRVPHLGLPLEQSVPCGLIINELVANALKHAFPDGRAGTVTVELHRADEYRLVLRVSDDGVGLPADFDHEKLASLGLRLVANLAAQLDGDLVIEPPAGNGAAFCVSFAISSAETTDFAP